MVLVDFDSYSKVHQKAENCMPTNRNGSKWHLSILLEQGRFAADRAIHEYAQNIWGATPVPAGEQKQPEKQQ